MKIKNISAVVNKDFVVTISINVTDDSLAPARRIIYNVKVHPCVCKDDVIMM